MYQLWYFTQEGRKRKEERYPEVRVTQLEGLFQNQHDTGYWELDCLDLLQLDSERVRNLLEQSGCKSLGKTHAPYTSFGAMGFFSRLVLVECATLAN